MRPNADLKTGTLALGELAAGAANDLSLTPREVKIWKLDDPILAYLLPIKPKANKIR